LFGGTLSINASFAYQNGLTQNLLSAAQSAAVELLPNTPGVSLNTQAAFVAAFCNYSGAGLNVQGCETTPIGMIQTVNTFRFNTLSVNYRLPSSITRVLRVPRASLAIEGSNLALHSNYRGKDPNVNAFSTVQSGDLSADLGQIPEPRTWWIKLNLGN
jgi:hypothetical protein